MYQYQHWQSAITHPDISQLPRLHGLKMGFFPGFIEDTGLHAGWIISEFEELHLANAHTCRKTKQ